MAVDKKILNLVLSADFPPYDKMVQTSLDTWDSIDVPGVETVYYFGESEKQSTEKFIYLPIRESLGLMGTKTMMAFEWALQNKEFDYIARPHSCIYVNKKALKEFVEGLPSENVFAGIQVLDNPAWSWGGIGWIFSRDVIQKLVDNKKRLRRTQMEDKAISYLANELGIGYTNGRGCSIDLIGEGDKWQAMCYRTESYTFNEFSEIKKDDGQYFFRVKNDADRNIDEMVMREIFKYLQ